MKNLTFNERQKIAALAMRFYQHLEWQPKVGDYYCLTREGLELFQIARTDGANFYISKVLPEFFEMQDAWEIETFKQGFGDNRVWVHPAVLEKVK